MYFIQRSTLLVLLLHQCIVNGFNIFDMDFGFNYLNRDINSIKSSFGSDEKLTARWFLQELDHFNSNDSRNWKMRYYEDLTYLKDNGPIYLLLGNAYWFKPGIFDMLANETHGAKYILVHRYYGDSKPFKNLDAENIKYLSSRQALADVANFISYLKSIPMYKTSKVVVIGGAYRGNLAAWMKVLYPTLIDAVISSSAPVLAQKDFFEFFENVKDNIERYGGTKCVDKITKQFEHYDSLLQSSEGIKQLKKDENICDTCDMTVRENQQLFFFFKTWDILYHSRTPEAIKAICESKNGKIDYSRFLNEYSTFQNSQDKKCITVYDFQYTINLIKEYRNEFGIYPQLYQTCTEFGQFPTTSSKKQPFLNIPLEFYIKICSELFGNSFNEKRVDEGIKNTNKLYGGLKPNVTNVVFTNGDMNPKRTLSVLEDLSNDAKAVVIPRAFECQDLYSESDKDSKELKEARKYVKGLIKQWIGASEYLN